MSNRTKELLSGGCGKEETPRFPTATREATKGALAQGSHIPVSISPFAGMIRVTKPVGETCGTYRRLFLSEGSVAWLGVAQRGLAWLGVA